MFSEQVKHESGIKRRYIENTKNKRMQFSERMRLKKRGATLNHDNKHMDRKVMKCYPRGPAFLRMVGIHTVSQLIT